MNFKVNILRFSATDILPIQYQTTELSESHNIKDYFFIMIAESRAGSQEQRSGAEEEKINSLDRNYNDVIRKNAGMLRKTFKKHGEALLMMRVPDAFRAQARHEGMWLQERLVGDVTGDSATQLYVAGANNNDLIKLSLTQETLKAQLEECTKKLRILYKLKAYGCRDFVYEHLENATNC